MMTGQNHGIFARGVVASYKGFFRKDVVLREVSFHPPTAGVFAIVGRNGAGKTTLFHVLMGFKPIEQGLLLLHGIAPRDFRKRRGVGFVPDGVRFPLGWTVLDVLRHGVDLTVPSTDRSEAIARAIERTKFTSDALGKRARSCSRGMQQRLKLAFAMIGEPSVLLLDEPFIGLDPPSRKAFREEIELARGAGAIILLATHDLAEVRRMADAVFLLADGAVRSVLKEGPMARSFEATLEQDIARGGEP